MNSFKLNLICWLFGHALPKPTKEYWDTPQEYRKGLVVRCERCNTQQPYKNFRSYRQIFNQQ